MKIEDVLNQIGQGVLTEESVKILTEAFNDAVSVTVKEKVELEVKNALEKLDEEHSSRLEKLLEAIDNNHTEQLLAVVEKIDTEHTEKLKYLIERNKKELTEDAKAFKDELVNHLSEYLELYLDETVPAKELKEAVENKRASKIVNQMKQVLSLDEEFINETVREAVQDGKKTIDALKEELNEAVKANIQINQQYKGAKAALLIESKANGFSKEKKDWVMRVLKEKDPEFIEENFDYTVKMFDRQTDSEKQVLVESAKKDATTVKNKVDTPKAEPVTQMTSQDGEVSGYLKVLEKQDRLKK